MSRRRKPPEPLPGPEYRHNPPVRVVCTERGQHAEVVLYRLTDTRHHAGGWHRQQEGIPDVRWPQEAPPGRPPIRNGSPVGWTRSDGGRTYQFECHACPGDKRVTEEHLFRAVDGLARLRQDDRQAITLDISLLSS